MAASMMSRLALSSMGICSWSLPMISLTGHVPRWCGAHGRRYGTSVSFCPYASTGSSVCFSSSGPYSTKKGDAG